VQPSVVEKRLLSEISAISVRTTSGVNAKKCIYPRLPLPSKAGGLEKLFVEWLDSDSKVKAFVKINEYKHDFLHLPYQKSDGMPARYSPDFLVRTDTDVFLVETKGDSSLTDENVKRKERAALGWCGRINELEPGDRSDREWHYVLLGETITHEWHDKHASVSDLLEYARIRGKETSEQFRL
jgi:type III restriction enzyme